MDAGALLSSNAKLALVRDSSLFRLGLSAWIVLVKHERLWGQAEHAQRNNRETVDFLQKASAKTRICIFLAPPAAEPGNVAHYSRLGVPLYTLKAEGFPDTYREIHPPANVYTWYARNLAAWLEDQGLAP